MQELWDKHVAEQIDVTPIYNVNAANYVLKYLQKTFDDSGKVRYDGNAWCYWVTNSKFYSISEDLEPIEKVVEKIIDLLHGYDAVIRLVECESYEYIGVCRASSVKDPPEILSDEWLFSHGWDQDVVYGNWLSPDYYYYNGRECETPPARADVSQEKSVIPSTGHNFTKDEDYN